MIEIESGKSRAIAIRAQDHESKAFEPFDLRVAMHGDTGHRGVRGFRGRTTDKAIEVLERLLGVHRDVHTLSRLPASRVSLPRMLRLTTALLLCSIACGKPAATKKDHLQAGDLAFVGATVVPMDREGALTDQIVVVRGDRIVLVAPAASIDTTGATVVDVKGKWLTPGLADMHVHTWSDHDFAMYLLNGVTTVRDMFGSPKHLEWRSAIQSGKLDGPTLFTAGPIVDGDPPTWPGSTVVTTADAAREAVRAQKKAGYDFIKVYNGLSAEAYDAIASEAKAQGIPFAGHVPKAIGIEKAIVSGQRSIEHLDGYIPFRSEPHVDAQIVAATAKSGVWNCPTLVVMDRIGRFDSVAGLEKTPGLEYVSRPCASNGIRRTTSAFRAGRRRCSRSFASEERPRQEARR